MFKHWKSKMWAGPLGVGGNGGGSLWKWKHKINWSFPQIGNNLVQDWNKLCKIETDSLKDSNVVALTTVPCRCLNSVTNLLWCCVFPLFHLWFKKSQTVLLFFEERCCTSWGDQCYGRHNLDAVQDTVNLCFCCDNLPFNNLETYRKTLKYRLFLCSQVNRLMVQVGWHDNQQNSSINNCLQSKKKIDYSMKQIFMTQFSHNFCSVSYSYYFAVTCHRLLCRAKEATSKTICSYKSHFPVLNTNKYINQHHPSLVISLWKMKKLFNMTENISNVFLYQDTN